MDNHLAQLGVDDVDDCNQQPTSAWDIETQVDPRAPWNLAAISAEGKDEKLTKLDPNDLTVDSWQYLETLVKEYTYMSWTAASISTMSSSETERRISTAHRLEKNPPFRIIARLTKIPVVTGQREKLRILIYARLHADHAY